MSKTRLLLILTSMAAGCGTKLRVPEGAQVTCQTQDDCPSGFRCRLSTGRCVEGTGNTPPAVSLKPIARSVAEVTIEVHVVDDESDPVSLDVALAQEPPVALDLGAASLPSSPTGEWSEIVWPAGDNFPDTAYRADLVLRISPRDQSGPGSVVESAPFAWGNDAPALSGVTIDQMVAGVVVVSFVPSDSSDPLDLVRFELSRNGSFDDTIALIPAEHLGSGQDFPVGDVVGMSGDGLVHSLAWDSRLAAPYSADHSRIRLTVSDGFAETSAVTPENSFVIRNQTAPGIMDVQVHLAGDKSESGDLPIIFQLCDNESDPTDVLFEVSDNEGQSWRQLTEAPSPLSEGAWALATQPLPDGGLTHRFVWNVIADLKAYSGRVRLRLTPADDAGVGNAVELRVDAGIPDFVPSEEGSTVPVAYTAGVALGDVDGDTYIDVALVDTSSTITIARNSGTGYLQTAETFAGSYAEDRIALANINGDSDLDLVLGNTDLRVYPGAAGTSFGAPVIVGLDGRRVRGLAIGDLESDGDLDVVAGSEDGLGAEGDFPLLVFLNIGSGLSAPVPYALPDNPEARDTVNIVRLGDLDGDGALDVAATHDAYAESLPVYFWLGNGAGALTLAKQDDLGDLVDLYLVDVDEDGRDDLVTLEETWREVRIYISRSTAGNVELADADVIPIDDEPAHIAVADLDGDAIDDLLVGGSEAVWGLLRWLPAPSRFAVTPPIRWFNVPADSYMAMALADLNGDAAIDLVRSSRGFSQIRAQRGIADPDGLDPWRFASPKNVGMALVADLRLMSLNRDGILDFVTVEGSEGNKSWAWLGVGESGLGQAEFESRSIGGDLDAPVGVIPCDLDADGADEVLVRLGTLDSDYLLWRNDGNGVLSGGEPLTDEPVRDLACADVTGDGNLDLVVCFEQTDTVALLRGDGQGGFSSTDLVSNTINSPRRVWITDLDGDARPDAFVTTVASTKWVVWDIAGTPVTEAVEIVEIVDEALSTDVDQDGVLDLILVGTMFDSAANYTGLGFGILWGSRQRQLSQEPPSFVPLNGPTLTDVNYDGLADFVASHQGAGLSIYVGLPVQNVYGEWLTQAGNFGALKGDCIGLADLNGDGVTDQLGQTVTSPQFLLPLKVGLGRRTGTHPLWSVPLTAVEGRATTFGDVLPAGHRTDSQVTTWLTSKPQAVSVPGSLYPPSEGAFALALLLSGLQEAGMRPLTVPWLWAGDRRLSRAVDGRLHWRPRLGPVGDNGEPVGLDLNVATGARGITVVLPFLEGRTASGTTRVLACITSFLLARDDPADPLFGSNDPDALPRAADGTDVLVPRCEWREILADEDGVLSAGSGSRFVVESDQIRVLTDALGTFQAFSVE